MFTVLKILSNTYLLGKLAKEAAVPTILVVVGIGSFALGRLSALDEKKVGTTTQPPSTQSAFLRQGAAQPGQKSFVASKSGTKYYAKGCVGASRIKPENEVWFATVADAQAAGFTEAANCSR